MREDSEAHVAHRWRRRTVIANSVLLQLDLPLKSHCRLPMGRWRGYKASAVKRRKPKSWIRSVIHCTVMQQPYNRNGVGVAEKARARELA